MVNAGDRSREEPVQASATLAVSEFPDPSPRHAPGMGGGHSLKPDGIGFILHSDRKGVIKEVIQDSLGFGSRLAPNVELTSLVSPFHMRRISGFFRSVRRNRSSYDCVLSVLGPSGLVRLYCSGFLVGHDILVITTVKPLSTSEISLSRLLALAAHDLLNPVGGILASCQYLLDDAAAALNPRQMIVLSSIESSTQLALQLIQNLAEIPTILSGQPEMHVSETDIVAVLRQAVSGAQDLANIRNVKVEIKGKDLVATLKGDPALLREAFYGVIITAIGSAKTPGTIEISVGMRDGEAVIELNRQYATALMAFAAEEGGASSRLVPSKLSDVHAGLLLARSKRILNAHSGTIKSKNRGKHGRSWTIKLPMAGQQSTRKQNS